MNEELSRLLSGVLSNPDALKGLMNSLPRSDDSRQLSNPPRENLPEPQSILNSFSGADDRRISLLTALKPYMSTSRSANIDRAIQLIKLTKLTEALRNEGK